MQGRLQDKKSAACGADRDAHQGLLRWLLLKQESGFKVNAQPHACMP